MGISGKTLRSWLRWRFPRGPLEHNKHWFLTEEQVSAAQLHFGGLYTPDHDRGGRPDPTSGYPPTRSADELSSGSRPSLTGFPTNHKALQSAYEPTALRVLFVGESPPASGKYFYACNSMLYFAMRDVFVQTLGRRTNGGFLDFFQELGCYLTDLSDEPLNQLSLGSPERVAARRGGVATLADLIRTRRPVALVGVLLDIEPEVRDAVDASGESPAVHFLPFPYGPERTRFILQLSALLNQFSEAGVFPGRTGG